jgi:O-antigen ligase
MTMDRKSNPPMDAVAAPVFAAIGRHALALGVAAIPVVGVFAPLGLASVVLVAALLCLVYVRVRHNAWPKLSAEPAIFLAALTAWSALGILWSVDPGLSVEKLARLASLFVAGLVFLGGTLRLRDENADWLSGCFFYGVLAAALALLVVRTVFVSVGTPFPIDGGRQMPLNPYNRATTIVAIFLWPAALYARRFGAWAPGGLAVGVLALLSTYASQSAPLATVLGIIAAALVYAHRLFAAALGGVVAVAILAMPLLPAALPPPKEVQAGMHLPGSSFHRLMIWNFTADRIGERPLFGWGLESSKVIPGNTTKFDGLQPLLPLHPHNGALQIWLELGVVGAIFAAAFAAFIGRAIQRLPRTSAAAAAGAFASMTAISFVSYGIWQSWWLAALFIAGIAVTLAQRAARSRA